MNIDLTDHKQFAELIESIHLKRREEAWSAFCGLYPGDKSQPRNAFESGFVNGIVQTLAIFRDNPTGRLAHISQSSN